MVKGEVVLGVLLVLRHRTVRLVGILTLLVLLLATVNDADGTSAHALFVVGGCLAAVAGSRLMAPGAALAAARRAAGSWWLAPTGRLAGVLLLLAPILAVGAAALTASGGGEVPFVPLAVAALLQAAALGAVTLALAPALGASAAGMLGLIGALLGGLRPSEMHELFAAWPYAQRLVVIAWNVLPLSWRAARWLGYGPVHDLVVLGAWVVAGVCLAAWAGARAPLGERRSGAGA